MLFEAEIEERISAIYIWILYIKNMGIDMKNPWF